MDHNPYLGFYNKLVARHLGLEAGIIYQYLVDRNSMSIGVELEQASEIAEFLSIRESSFVYGVNRLIDSGLFELQTIKGQQVLKVRVGEGALAFALDPVSEEGGGNVN